MSSDITAILKKLELPTKGKYENQFYVIPLTDSDEYAKMYTNLDKNAINTEYPNIGKNTANSTVKITNYFELDEKDITYNIFLIADFEHEKYFIKIGEK